MLFDSTFILNSVDDFSIFFFFSSRRRHTIYWRDWSSDVCSSDLRCQLQLPDHRVERDVAVVRRALVAQPEMLAFGNALTQRAEHPRLADAGRTGQQHHLSLAGTGQLPAVKQQANLVLTADERGQPGAVCRLEPACHGALRQYTPDRDRLCKTLQNLIGELVQLEYVAHQGPGRCINQ